ncbi:MAG: hypothetical protein ISQ42_04835 [Flavobacteriaceae bacterium]|nr:hypothetical protein [Flavobacteriaceae bacterium]
MIERTSNLGNCTVLIFLNSNKKGDIDRFNKLLKPSINFISKKILVVPKYNPKIEIDKSYEILLDRQIVKNYHMKAYDKQMILKLLVSRLINTKFYLVLDTDNICNKKFTLKQLFQNEKIMLSIYNGYKYFLPENKNINHSIWLHAAKNILNVKNISNPFYYANTPVLFVTKYVKKLLNELDNKTGNFSKYYKDNYLLYSEYSLYFMYIQKYNLYKNESEEPGLISGVWTDSHSLLNLNNDKIFWVIQSHLKIPIKKIKERQTKSRYSCVIKSDLGNYFKGLQFSQ